MKKISEEELYKSLNDLMISLCVYLDEKHNLRLTINDVNDFKQWLKTKVKTDEKPI